MPIWLRIPLGLIIMAIGFLIVWKTETMFKWFGAVPWAEEHLGSGQTRLFYKLIGVLIAFIGIFTVTNIISSILGSFAGIFVR
jgi:uncharacterized membrane protein YkgB